MDTPIDELDVVQVVALLETNRHFTGTEGICRAPRIGDLAAIVHVLDKERLFIAEAVDANGLTVWLADFHAEELQLRIKHSANA